MSVENDTSVLYGPKIVGPQVREILAGKYEVIPKTVEHIHVDQDVCIGCRLCYEICPTGSFTFEGGAAAWDGMETCAESGACRYVCPVGAIDWSYPEGGTGVVNKYC